MVRLVAVSRAHRTWRRRSLTTEERRIRDVVKGELVAWHDDKSAKTRHLLKTAIVAAGYAVRMADGLIDHLAAYPVTDA